MLPTATFLSIVSTHRLQSRFAFALALALGIAALPGVAACGGGAPAGGIHARMGYSDSDGLRVVEVPAHGPAAVAGLEVDDRIIRIDEESVRGMSMTDVVESLRGPAGSPVVLDFVRDGEVYRVEVMRTPYEEASTR